LASILEITFLVLIIGVVLGGTTSEITGLMFLRMGGGARSAGLGGAYTAVASDAFSARWNPATLPHIPHASLGLSHNQWYQDIRQEEIVFSNKAGKAYIGLVFANQTVNNIEYRLNVPTDSPLGKFAAYDFALGMSLAAPVNNNFSIGAGVKWLYEKIYLDHAQGLSWDVGLYHEMKRLPLNFSLVYLDMGNNIKMSDYELPLPSRLIVGLSYHLPTISSRFNAMITVDYVRPKYEGQKLNTGMELTLDNLIALRVGYRWGYNDIEDYTLGLGFHAGITRIDYAYQPFRSQLGDVHRFGLVIGF